MAARARPTGQVRGATEGIVTDRRRLWVVLFAGAAVAALVLLAAGLPDLELSEGQALPRFRQAADTLYTPGQSASSKLLGDAIMVLFFVALLLLPISLVYLIFSPDARKRVLRSLGLLLWLVAFVLLIRAKPDFFEQLQGAASGGWLPEEAGVAAGGFSANPPLWAVWGTAIFVGGVVAAALVTVAWVAWRQTRPPEGSLVRISQEAQEALAALQAGADLKDIVLRCYSDMSQVLREQRGISRDKSMTPREFAQYLGEAGLHNDQIARLTYLFENVRYGAKVPGKPEEQEAVACLSAIVKACQEAA
jgi:hypothetical protein